MTVYTSQAPHEGAEWCFPLAAAGGVARERGADYDRRWLVVDGDGRWLSRADCPRLQEIEVELRLGYLVLRAPGMLRLDIPLDVIEDDDSVRRTVTVGAQAVDAVDEGDLAAAWLTGFLERPCRLAKVHPEAPPVAWPD